MNIVCRFIKDYGKKFKGKYSLSFQEGQRLLNYRIKGYSKKVRLRYR